MRAVSVTGTGMTRFGRQGDTLKSLALAACREALRTAGHPRIGAVYAGNFLGGQLAGQEIIGSILAKELGLGPIPAVKMEGACASGGIAFRQAYLMIAAGVYDTALVVGVEKMTHAAASIVTEALNSAMDNDSSEGMSGLTFPGFFGVVANRYMHEFGAGREHLSMVALKNRSYAQHNPHAQFRKPATLDEIQQARLITDPLGLYHCSPITDGAAAVVIAAGAGGIRVLASGQASGPPLMQDIPDLLTIEAIRQAAQQAYAQAGAGPEDIDVAEVHDCFAMTELLAVEDLGFFAKGTAWQAIEAGKLQHGGEIPVNTSGGLLSRGHPIGATGVAQIVQIAKQLQGQAVNQVEGARLGLAQNLGGTGAYATVHIFGK
ncbi:acetyl-CoA C-acetyltransferase [Paenibacillus phyllosphaerae]|uniref:propanoyl-CoA C-acyltransferase n=1 Tax=Paenibacillus phyllosphaerae TaxID=274593 RepID=A0A7W5FPV6_9BACL|nr:beta-ketoacyl synthase N-terminal-like domain-containing protein [Paenibacillus phyllosphaerae]MBB3112780.1 acetyl-CoA C-acetyltransferase [Paenibacillus phyllosphaerae]